MHNDIGDISLAGNAGVTKMQQAVERISAIFEDSAETKRRASSLDRKSVV